MKANNSVKYNKKNNQSYNSNLFIINKIITLMVKDYKIKKILISAEISQDLLLSLILYLFYAVKLLKVCNNMSKKLNISKFINDISFFIYRLFIKQNCRILIKV